MKREKIVKIIKVCFWIYIVIQIMYNFITITSISGINKNLNGNINNIINSVFFCFVNNIELFIIYFAIIIGNKLYKRAKLSLVDFEKSKEYYREILEENSVAELSYIDDFEITDNTIAASILSLKQKKKIDFEEKTKEIYIKDANGILKENEKYIINNIRDGKLKDFNKDEYSIKVKEDAEKSQLIMKSTANKKIRLTIIVIMIAILLGSTLIVMIKGMSNGEILINHVNIIVIALIFMILFNIPLALIVITIIYNKKMSENPYIRTQYGEEINKKLEGLKKYIIDHSTMQQAEIQQVELWEEYLVYSVMFRQNNKIKNEIYDNYIEYNKDI